MKTVILAKALTSNLIKHTQALCPICLEVLDAEIVDEDGKVWMCRSCPEHGEFSTLIWPDAEHYRWFTSLAAPFARPNPGKKADKPCPFACGICTRHVRKPTLVEIEVTQRCNIKCPVCFMSAMSEKDIAPDFTIAEFEPFYKAIAESAGIQTGVQLTGGEPTVRDDLKDIIYMGRQMGFWGIEVNTNGIRVAKDQQYLRDLIAAGLTGVYLQFDGLIDSVYKSVRGMPMLETKMQAIENCRTCKTQVVLAMTIISGTNDDQIGAVIDFACANNDVIAGVALQPAFTSGRFDAKRATPMNMGDVIFMLETQTNGLIQAKDIWPLSSSHPICDSGTYLLNDGKAFKPVTRNIDYQDYMELHNPDSPQGSVFLDIVDDMLESGRIEDDAGLSVIIMNYMDSFTMDIERIKECSMFVTMKDGRLIPFCSYQLTNMKGERVYAPYGT